MYVLGKSSNTISLASLNSRSQAYSAYIPCRPFIWSDDILSSAIRIFVLNHAVKSIKKYMTNMSEFKKKLSQV